MKLKTKKSITKRFKFTKSGKVMRRATGQDHYREKKTGSQRRKKRKWIVVTRSYAKRIKKLAHM